ILRRLLCERVDSGLTPWFDSGVTHSNGGRRRAPMPKRLPDDVYSLLRCVCDARTPLERAPESLTCTACGAVYPIIDGVPVILDRRTSVFDPDDVIASHRTQRPGRLESAVRAMLRFVPKIGSNLAAGNANEQIREMLRSVEAPKVLVVGGGEAGAGLETLLDDPRYTMVES